MNLASEELQFSREELQFSRIADILEVSVSIPKKFPKIFYLITLTRSFPLSFAILAHSLFTHPIFAQIQLAPPPAGQNPSFSSFSTSSFYSPSLDRRRRLHRCIPLYLQGRPFSSTIAAIPSVFKRLFITFFCVSLSMVVHVYISALWHLASVVSVLEPVYGFAAMKKSYQLLKGMTTMGFVLVFVYLTVCGVINELFGLIVVHGGDDFEVLSRIIVGGFLVGVLVIVNLIGILVQSVFYYVCKSYHHQGIDKSALYDHLGGYLGEYVPLASSIQMVNLEA